MRLISGGTRPNQGHNLFHSFQEFSIPEGVTAQFDNVAGIENIFARVTGRSRSEISGTIRAGNVNLFLLNPNGIIFGRNASLDIGGSFLASTADRIRFEDGSQFSAVNPRATPLLTMSVPTGLQFGANPQPIINASRYPQELENPLGLEVSAGETLGLVGGRVTFPGGVATAAGGRIELGAVAAFSTVGLTPRGNSFTLSYRNVPNFQDIQFSDLATVDVSSEQGGSVQIQGRNIRLSNASLINADTLETSAIGNIRINAAEALTLRGGSQISTSIVGTGQSGDVIVTANSVELIGTGAPEPGSDDPNRPTPSTISSQVDQNASGRGGNVRIQTQRLIAQNGGSIEASTSGQGRAGNIRVQANAIVLSGSDIYGSTALEQAPSGIFAQVGLNPVDDTGDAGSINIQTRDLTLLDGAQISSAARLNGRGGNVTIAATGLIRLSGQSRTASATVGRSGIFASAERGASQNAGEMTLKADQLIVANQGEISANNFGPAQGGTINIDVNQLTVQGGSDIRATSALREGIRGEGLAGNIIIKADLISLDQGRLTAETDARATPGISNANVQLQDVDFLLLQNRSQISARALLNALGGNVTIRAPGGFVVAAAGDNDIRADAFRGRGGNITIEAQSILGLAEREAIAANNTNDIDASSDFGAPGSVTLTTPDVDPSRGLTELPIDPIDASSLISQNCLTSSTIATTQGEFVITGRSGLPPSPNDPRNSEATPGNWVTLNSTARSSPSHTEQMPTVSPSTIVEAQGWTRDANGVVTLVAETPAIVQTPIVHQQCPNTLSRN